MSETNKRQPYAYAVYFPDQPKVELVHDLDELTDDLTNREHVITALYAECEKEPHGWLYEWTHSSATGKPDTTCTSFTTDEAYARKHDNCRAIYTAPQQAPQKEAQEPGEIPESIERMATDRYKVVPSHGSMFHRWAVVAGSGTQQLYLGREVECQNMARKFAGAFLDGAFVTMQSTSPNPAPAPLSEREAFEDWYTKRHPTPVNENSTWAHA
jgi:hypothetical protein